MAIVNSTFKEFRGDYDKQVMKTAQERRLTKDEFTVDKKKLND